MAPLTGPDTEHPPDRFGSPGGVPLLGGDLREQEEAVGAEWEWIIDSEAS